MKPEVSWIASSSKRPICDVPWLGNSLVLADGTVNFCCHSSSSVGNVNQERFEQIWNGERMQKIRKALTNQVLPPECRSSSCPIYRGDDRHYIVDRMKGPNGTNASDNSDPHGAVRERITGEIKLSEPVQGQMPSVTLQFTLKGAPVVADIFVALSLPDKTTTFLPNHLPFAVPFRMGVELCEQEEVLEIGVSAARKGTKLRGKYSLCAALFQPNENPNILSNCYWSSSSEFTIK